VLRITIVDTPAEQKWILQGRLIGPWAGELMANWKRAHAEGNGQGCVVDLNEVTFIDTNGEKVLAKMMKQGAHFIVSGLYATHVIENIQARFKSRVHKTFLLLIGGLLCLASWPSRVRAVKSTQPEMADLHSPRGCGGWHGKAGESWRSY
jgi:hypothetical protein